MTQLFLSHSHTDLACAERIRADLEAAGYEVWKDTQSIAPGSPSWVRAIDSGVRGSAGIIVVWSAHAAASEWVEREILFAQRLKKTIYPVICDGTEPGLLLVAAQYIDSASPCLNAVNQLLPHLPPVSTEDKFQETSRLLGHSFIRERQKGIGQAEELLKAGNHRAELLALLEELAQSDQYMIVREDAGRVLGEDTKRNQSPQRDDESRHIFPVRCPNGHVSDFDKRRVCRNDGTVKRLTVRRAGKELDEIYLKCAACGEQMIVPVDCEDYR